MTATSSSASQPLPATAEPLRPVPSPAPTSPPLTSTPTVSAAGAARISATDSSSAFDEPSIGKLVSEASTHMSTLVRSEIELAKLELRATVKNAGVGIGFFGAAAAILVFSLVFAFLTVAEGLNALGLARWLSFLIVFVIQLLLAGAFAFLGIKKVKKVKAPERTIRTTKETVGYLKSHPK